MRIIFSITSALAPLLLAAVSAAGTVDWSEPMFKPSLLHSSADSRLLPALKFSYAPSLKADSAMSDFAVKLDTRATIATEAKGNSEASYASLGIGYSQSFGSETRRPGPVVDANGKITPLIQSPFAGIVSALVASKIETTQSFSTSNFTFGPRFGYTLERRPAWAYILPDAYFDYQRVFVLHSAEANGRGEHGGFWRADATAAWELPLGNLAPDNASLRPLQLQAELKYSRAFSLDSGAAQAGYQHALYYAGALVYNLRAIRPERPVKLSLVIPAIYVQVGHGKMLPAKTNQTMIFVGFVFGRPH